MNIAVKEWNGDIVFLRRLIPGPADRSYGIEVARLAGVPAPVVQRARDILAQLEAARGKARVAKLEAAVLPGLDIVPAKAKTVKEAPAAPAPQPAPEPQPEPPVLEALRRVNPDAMTPMEALRLLSDWKMLWGMPERKEEPAPGADSAPSEGQSDALKAASDAPAPERKAAGRGRKKASDAASQPENDRTGSRPARHTGIPRMP